MIMTVIIITIMILLIFSKITINFTISPCRCISQRSFFPCKSIKCFDKLMITATTTTKIVQKTINWQDVLWVWLIKLIWSRLLKNCVLKGIKIAWQKMISLGKYLCRVNDEDNRTASIDIVQSPLLLTWRLKV